MFKSNTQDMYLLFAGLALKNTLFKNASAYMKCVCVLNIITYKDAKKIKKMQYLTLNKTLCLNLPAATSPSCHRDWCYCAFSHRECSIKQLGSPLHICNSNDYGFLDKYNLKGPSKWVYTGFCKTTQPYCCSQLIGLAICEELLSNILSRCPVFYTKWINYVIWNPQAAHILHLRIQLSAISDDCCFFLGGGGWEEFPKSWNNLVSLF